MKKWLFRTAVLVLVAAACAGGFAYWRSSRETSDQMALSRSTDELVRMLSRGLEGSRQKAAFALGRKGDTAAVPALIAQLQSSNERVRRAAAMALGELEDDRAVPGLLGMLHDPGRLNRAAAAMALGQLRAERAVEPLGALLDDPEWTVRQAAAQALGCLPSPPARDLLVKAQSDENSLVRQTVAVALGRQGSGGSADASSSQPNLLLKDADPAVRRRAVKSADVTDTNRLAEIMALVTEDPDGQVRSAAFYRILNAPLKTEADVKRMTALHLTLLRNPDNNIRYQAFQFIGNHHPDEETVARAVEGATDPDPEVRDSVRIFCSNYHPTNAWKFLIPLAGHTNIEVRRTVAASLMAFGGQPGVAEALERMQASNLWAGIENQAPHAVKDGMDVKGFIERARSWDPEVRQAAVGEMWRWRKDPRVIEVLLERLRDPEPQVVKKALWALANQQDPATAPAVLAVAESTNAVLREEARLVLKRIDKPAGIRAQLEVLHTASADFRHSWANSFMNEKPAPEEYQGLLRLLMDPDYGVASEAAERIVKYNDGRSGEAVHKALVYWTGRLKEEGIKSEAAYAGHTGEVILHLSGVAASYADTNAVPALIENLDNSCEKARMGAAAALGRIGDERAVPKLITAMTDQDPGVRGAALAALGNFKSKDALERVSKSMRSSDAGVAQQALLAKLQQTGAADKDPALFLEGVVCPNRGVAQFAALKAAETGDPRYIKGIIALYPDEKSEDVRRAWLVYLSRFKEQETVGFIRRTLEREPYSFRMIFRSRARFDLNPELRIELLDIKQPAEETGIALGDLNREKGTIPFEALLARTNHPSPVVRGWVAAAAAERKEAGAADLLAGMTEDADPTVVTQAVASLGSRKEPKALDLLLGYAGGPPRERALSAVERIGRFKDPRADALLLDRLSGTDAAMRGAALKAAAVSRSPKLLEALLALAVKPEPDQAVLVLGALAGYKDPRVMPLVKAQANHPDPEVRRKALQALAGFSRNPEAADAILAGLADTQEIVLVEALNQSAKLASSNRLSRILPLVKDERQTVRLTALRALASLKNEGGPEAVLAFIPLQPPEERFVILRMLASSSMRAQLVAPLLQEIKTATGINRVNLVHCVLPAVRAGGSPDAEWNAAVEALIALLQDPDSFLAATAKQALQYELEAVKDKPERKKILETALKGDVEPRPVGRWVVLPSKD